MAGSYVRRLPIALLLLVSAPLAARPARAESPGDPRRPTEDTAPRRIRQEWLGVELSLGGYVTDVSNTRAIYPDPEQPHGTAGWGGIVRFGRRHFGAMYWSPVALTIYDGRAGASLGYVALQTELGGSVLSAGAHALDLGLAVGFGYMGLHIGGGCDGSCALGGGLLLFAPVIRYVYTTPVDASVGLSVRLLRPVDSEPGGEGPYGHIRGSTGVIMLALDLAYGSR